MGEVIVNATLVLAPVVRNTWYLLEKERKQNPLSVQIQEGF